MEGTDLLQEQVRKYRRLVGRVPNFLVYAFSRSLSYLLFKRNSWRQPSYEVAQGRQTGASCYLGTLPY